MKVAITHDWLIGGGAEKVVLELHRMFPEAPIFTSYCTKEWREKLDYQVITGYLQYWPFSKLRKFLPLLRARWFQSLNLDGYDLIISSKGNGEANYLRVPKGTMHICYCHSPTHFYWRHYDQYISQPGFGFLNPVVRFWLKKLVSVLRKKDFEAAQMVDYFIANSSHTQSDIKKYYKRDSYVIYPPVDTQRFKIHKQEPRENFVTVGRLVPYKRVDLIIKACNRLNLSLTVVGRGPELANLKRLAGQSITFDTTASDKQVVKYLQTAKAFIFAAYEDFGISPVEAMAAGTPVIAYQAGGALDYLIPGKTGIFFDNQTVKSLVSVLQKFNSQRFNITEIVAQSQQFSINRFHEDMLKIVKVIKNKT